MGKRSLCAWLILVVLFGGLASAHAQITQLPSGADIERRFPAQQTPPPTPQKIEIKPPSPSSTYQQTKAPEGSEKIHFKLRAIRLEGVTAYKAAEFVPLWKPLLEKDIALDILWIIADRISKQYRDDGYFLSRAYVPGQQINPDGTVIIRVVEGHIGKVNIDEAAARKRLVQDVLSEIRAEKPLTLKTLEKQQLFLNEITGVYYQATLSPIENPADEGAVAMTFTPAAPKKGQGQITLDNLGSRYIGPYNVTATWKGQIIELQDTSITAAISAPTQTLKRLQVTQTIPLTPATRLELSGGYTTATPGFTLKPQDVESRTFTGGATLVYEVMRSRLKNLTFRFGVDGREAKTDVLSTPLTRDHVRTISTGMSYSNVDGLNGYNDFSATLTHGLGLFNSSMEGDDLLSRSGATPDFFKADFSFTRLQRLGDRWNAKISLAGQKASSSLFSSEEFGYGGNDYGRGYDSSEISGDQGIKGALEIRYMGLKPLKGTIQLYPYGFYDAGKVWNHNYDQENALSAASAGLGISFNINENTNGFAQMAMPLTKPADTPQRGKLGKAPRYSFQLNRLF